MLYRLFLIIAWVSFSAWAQSPHYDNYRYSPYGRLVALPDPSITPGKIRTTNAAEICASTFRTKKYRVATKNRAVLKEVCAKYQDFDCPKRGKKELDDLIPVELGGENVPDNLWVQPSHTKNPPLAGYQEKDVLENWLHKQVCTKPIESLMKLTDAQNAIRTDWYQAYLKMPIDRQ